MARNHNVIPSLCLDCRNSTKPSVCSWARNFTPVKGWEAVPTRHGGFAPFDSYRVISCPKFKRGSLNAGMVKDIFCGEQEPAKIDDEDAKNLASAIICRYVEDWKYLEYGNLDNLFFCGDQLYRDSVLRFFASQWFEDLLNMVSPGTDPNKVCEALHITKSMLMEVVPLEPKSAR